MAEAEDVITDVARHATIFARDLWRRHRPAPKTPRPIELSAVAERINLLVTAVFGQALPIRIAQPPARITFLQLLAKRRQGPSHDIALPAADAGSIWLPRDLGIFDIGAALERYRVLALRQAMRTVCGSTPQIDSESDPLVRDIYLLLQAAASDAALSRQLPGMSASINALRRDALARRPPLDAFPAARRPLEALVRTILQTDCNAVPPGLPIAQSASDLYRDASGLAQQLPPVRMRVPRGGYLFKDLWTGELRQSLVEPMPQSGPGSESQHDNHEPGPPRVGRLDRKPEVRKPQADEDDETQGMFMIQPEKPHEHAEDPLGMQRPTDRDQDTATEELAESLSELPEARLVTTPGSPKEVLLSDDAPDMRSKMRRAEPALQTASISYPEWDYRTRGYRDPGAIVRLSPAPPGPQAWVAATLEKHHAMLNAIRRRFEMLRAHRVRLSRQLDGEDIDLEAYIEGYADFRAGRSMTQALYQTHRPVRRDMAIALLIDVSGSTDGWISENRRIIDVEREALLLVCIALEGMGEPYTVQAFSGEGPGHVTIRNIKGFDERYSNDIALRIAALEPEHYTRAGAALRHATTLLMRQTARHRLLLLLSDGKPNDVDDYEGRYGVEDMRQAVIEAQLQGISSFCLTIDRHAAGYLPQVFGARRYALLPRPELLPTVLLDWMKRLMIG